MVHVRRLGKRWVVRDRVGKVLERFWKQSAARAYADAYNAEFDKQMQASKAKPKAKKKAKPRNRKASNA
jgi:chorismate mutase